MGDAPTLGHPAEALGRGEQMIDGEPVTTTLAEHGPRPLMGISEGQVEFEPRGLANMVRIGEVIDGDPQYEVWIGRKTVALAAMGMRRLGSVSFKGLDLEERMAHVAKLRTCDLMYLSLYRLAMGDAGKVAQRVKTTCSACGGQVDAVLDIDIGKLQVIAWPTIPTAYYRLIHPWKVMGVEVETVTVRPPAIAQYLLGASQAQWDSEPIRNTMRIAGGVVELNGLPRPLTFDVVRKTFLHPDDVEAIVRILDNSEGQIGAFVNHEHDCGAALKVEVDWRRGFFWHSGA